MGITRSGYVLDKEAEIVGRFELRFGTKKRRVLCKAIHHSPNPEEIVAWVREAMDLLDAIERLLD